ncbi:hypothetical protein [Kaistella sp.]
MKKLTPNYDEGMWKGVPASSFLKAKEMRIMKQKQKKYCGKG